MTPPNPFPLVSQMLAEYTPRISHPSCRLPTSVQAVTGRRKRRVASAKHGSSLAERWIGRFRQQSIFGLVRQIKGGAFAEDLGNELLELSVGTLSLVLDIVS